MARSSPPELPRTGHVATYGLETVQFFAPVSLGILGALFGVVAVSGAALVLNSSGVPNSTVDSVPAATAQGVAEPDVPSDQSPPASPTNETPATDIPEVGNKDLEADTRVEPKADQVTVAERRSFAALSEQAMANFAECPLVDAVEFLSRRHQIPILLDIVAIEEAGLLVDEPINLVLAGVTLRSVLNIMLSDLELTFIIEDEVMKITTVEVARERLASRANVTEDRKLVEQSDDAPAEGGGVTVNPKRPLDDVRSKAGILPIARTAAEQNTVNLCSIVGVPARSIQLELVGNEFADGKQLTLTNDDANNDASSLWKVIQKPASALERQIALGQFEFSDERLSFLAAANSDSSLLPFCMLRISTVDPPDTELCQLWEPLRLQDVSVLFEDASTVYNLIPERLPQLPVNELRVTIEIAGYGDCVFPAGKKVTVGSPVTVDVMNRDVSSHGKLFTTRFSLTSQDNRPLLEVSHFAELPQVALRNAAPSISLSEQPLSTAGMAVLRRNVLRQQTDIKKLIESKSQLSSRATSFTVKRELDTEIGTLIDTGSALNELATRVAALKDALEEISGSGRTGVRLVRRFSNEDEIVILETQLFSER